MMPIHTVIMSVVPLMYPIYDLINDSTLPILNLAKPNNQASPLSYMFTVFTIEEEITPLSPVRGEVN